MYTKIIIQIVLYTVLMVVMIIGLKKASIYVQEKNYLMYKDKNMKILEKIVISRDREIFLVELYGKKYFLGSSQNTISLLKELDAENDQK